MSEESPAITYGRFIRWLREFIHNEIRATSKPKPVTQPTVIRVVPAYPQGARPLFHLSDEDCGWLMDQPGEDRRY